MAIRGGYLYVAEMASCRLQVLTWPACELRQLLPLPAASPMGLRGVAVGADGTVYVADLRGRRILALPPVGARTLPAAEQARLEDEQRRYVGAVLQSVEASAAQAVTTAAPTAAAAAVAAEAAAAAGAAEQRRPPPMRLRGVGFEVEDVVEGGMRRLLIEEDEEVDDDGEGEGAEEGEEEGEEGGEEEEAEGQAGEEAAGEREEAGGEEAGLPQALGCDRVDGRKGEASPRCPAESRAAEPLQTEHACALDQPD